MLDWNGAIPFRVSSGRGRRIISPRGKSGACAIDWPDGRCRNGFGRDPSNAADVIAPDGGTTCFPGLGPTTSSGGKSR